MPRKFTTAPVTIGGAKLAKAIKDHGRNAVANAINSDVITLSRLVKGTKEITAVEATAIETVYGIPINDWCQGVGK